MPGAQRLRLQFFRVSGAISGEGIVPIAQKATPCYRLSSSTTVLNMYYPNLVIRPAKTLLAFALWGLGATAWSADFTVVASYPTYTINGQANPGLTLLRGKTYTFSVNASSHPFYIKSIQGNPANAPGTLYYDCSIHASMTGTITIVNPPVPPAPRILNLAVGSNLDLRFTGSNTFSYFPEFNTNLTTTNWYALTVVQTNAAPNGTNDVICGRPPSDHVFIRVRAQ
jgi:hypothetical protein